MPTTNQNTRANADSTAAVDPSRIDTLLHPDWLLPIAVSGLPTPDALENHSVALCADKIVEIGPREYLIERAPHAKMIELPHRLLTPGLVNAHCHAAMTLLRGWAEDLTLQPWLFDRIWPTEQRLVSREFVAFGSRLAMAEMLLSGTTCFSDMYFFPDAVADEATRAGIRTQLAYPIMEHPNAWARDVDQALALGAELQQTHRANPLVSVAFGPHSAYSASETALARINALSKEQDTPIQIHLHENAAEVSAAQEQGERWLSVLHRLGLMNSRLQAVHMTQLTQPEIELAAQSNTNVIHCPASNMKLASGACPTRDLLDAGVTLGLGTDGAASSNSLDMLQAARLMSLLAKHHTQDASQVTAFECLHAATLGSAQALGLADRIGSIEPGKQADLVAFDLSHPGMLPLLDPVAQLVHTEAGSRVSDVWINGREVVKDSGLKTIDHAALVADAGHWQQRVQALA